MPTLSASDYTNYVKARAASLAYQNGSVPLPIQRVSQPYATQSVLNAQLLASQAAFVVNAATTTITPSATTVSAARNDILSAAVGNGTIITYTSSVAHGLSNGQVVTITGFLTFLGANITGVVTSTGSTTFTIPYTATTGTATGTGSITGYVYYTTAAAHAFTTSTTNLTISGLATPAFNLSLVSVALVPTTTVFAVATTATGTAVSTQTGTMTITRYGNTNQTTSIARVRPYNGVGYVNQPKNLSTVGKSGTLSSGKTQQLGGLPLTAAKWDGVYAPVAHLARVDTKATGAYKSVRQPV